MDISILSPSAMKLCVSKSLRRLSRSVTVPRLYKNLPDSTSSPQQSKAQDLDVTQPGLASDPDPNSAPVPVPNPTSAPTPKSAASMTPLPPTHTLAHDLRVLTLENAFLKELDELHVLEARLAADHLARFTHNFHLDRVHRELRQRAVRCGFGRMMCELGWEGEVWDVRGGVEEEEKTDVEAALVDAIRAAAAVSGSSWARIVANICAAEPAGLGEIEPASKDLMMHRKSIDGILKKDDLLLEVSATGTVADVEHDRDPPACGIPSNSCKSAIRQSASTMHPLSSSQFKFLKKTQSVSSALSERISSQPKPKSMMEVLKAFKVSLPNVSPRVSAFSLRDVISSPTLRIPRGLAIFAAAAPSILSSTSSEALTLSDDQQYDLDAKHKTNISDFPSDPLCGSPCSTISALSSCFLATILEEEEPCEPASVTGLGSLGANRATFYLWTGAESNKSLCPSEGELVETRSCSSVSRSATVVCEDTRSLVCRGSKLRDVGKIEQDACASSTTVCGASGGDDELYDSPSGSYVVLFSPKAPGPQLEAPSPAGISRPPVFGRMRAISQDKPLTTTTSTISYPAPTVDTQCPQRTLKKKPRMVSKSTPLLGIKTNTNDVSHVFSTSTNSLPGLNLASRMSTAWAKENRMSV